jgi:exosortase
MPTARAEANSWTHMLGPLARITSARELLPFVPHIATAIAFGFLFFQPFTSLVSDWWNSPEAGHGLLLAPVSVWLAYKAGIRPDVKGQAALGIVMLVVAIVVRCASGLAAELFTMRASMILAIMGLVVYAWGVRQLLHWWLPFTLAALSVPLPELITQALALPLQFKASQLGAALLRSRDMQVMLTGNVIRIPGHELFVTEACSGLRSLTALLSLAILMGALMLRTGVARVLLVLFAIPVAVIVNGIRVFLTGFLVYFVDPALGQGFMHTTEGWLLFIVSLSVLGGVVYCLSAIETRIGAGSSDDDSMNDDAAVEALASREGVRLV